MLHAYHRATLTVLAALALMSLSVGSASAHAKYKSSTPAADSSMAAAPAQVSVTFDNHGALQAEGSLLKVTDAAGAVVDVGDTALDKNDADRTTLVVSLRSGLANGTYTVSWTAFSADDGSTATGSFTFTVGAAAPAATPQQLPQTSTRDSLPSGALPLAALLLVLGLGLRYRLARAAR